MTKHDELVSSNPALVSAVTIEDGVGSAVVLFPSPLVLFHNVQAPPIRRELVPFQQLKPYTGGGRELQILEQQLFKLLRAGSAAWKCGLSEGETAKTSSKRRKTEDGGIKAAPEDLARSRYSEFLAAAQAAFEENDRAAMGERLEDFKRGLIDTGRLSIAELTTSLKKGGFSEPEVTKGIRQLSRQQKILVVDELAFVDRNFDLW